MTNRRRRLGLLEHHLARDRSRPDSIISKSEEEWLVQFQELEAEGFYEQKPEFPELLSRFQLALQGARQDPPCILPEELSKALMELLRLTRRILIAQGEGMYV